MTAIKLERQRQEKAAGTRFRHTLASNKLHDSDRLALLTRELGEVAQATNLPATDLRPELLEKQHAVLLRDELIQVAALAVAWVEHLDCHVLGR